MGILSKLKNGNTVFRSLSFEKDRPNGGTSNSPYIQTPIPGLDQNPGPFNVEDTILRGSLKAPISAKDDILRLTKYLFDIKNIDGYLFTVKQNLLSRISPKTEASFGLGYGGASKEMAVTGVVGGLYTGNVSIRPNNGAVNDGIYNPLSTILQAGVGYLGTHLNKQGLDPTGTIPSLSINKYQDVTSANNKSIPEDPKVPFSLIKQSQKANLKASRKVSQFSNQESKTNAELNANFQGLSNIPFSEFNQPTKFQKATFAFLSKWDSYLDKQAVKKLERKGKAADDAIDKANILNNQVESAMNAPKVYTNRLLKLWNDSGLNLNNPFESISSTIYSYGGGPNSIAGIGKTNINFATTNDGITPSRTNILPFEPFIRPQVTYLLDNIFGNNSVSISYTNLLGRTGGEINEIDLFSSLDYLNSYNSSPYFNAPWDTQDVKIIDSLRETSNGTKVSYYQKEFALAAANSNNPQIPITKDVISKIKVRGPLGASTQFLSSYNTTDNAKEIDKKVFIIQDENPNHQSWASQDPTTFGSLANKAFEENDPYVESKYSKDLNHASKLTPDSELGFTTSNGTEIDFNEYKGASYEYNQNSSPLTSTSDKVNDSSSPDPFTPNLSTNPLTPGVNEFYNKADIPNTTEYHPSYEKTRKEESQITSRNIFPNIRHEFRVGTGEPGRVSPSYTKPLDTINAQSVYTSNGNGVGRGALNDFVHFRIGIVDAKTTGGKTYYMNFRSYIDSFSDTFGANWTDIKYMGRGEPFKRYSNFTRTINMSFTVVATSQGEMYGIYDKLRLLATSVAPSYTNAGYMAGNFAKLTVGGYVFEQYGIITGFTYDIPQEASWDLTIGNGAALKDELPMMIKVTGFTFIPIYDFIPQFTDSEKFRWLSNNIPNSKKAQQNKDIKEYNSPISKNSNYEENSPEAEQFNNIGGVDSNYDILKENTGIINTNSSNVLVDPLQPTNPIQTETLINNGGTEVTGLDIGNSVFSNFNY